MTNSYPSCSFSTNGPTSRKSYVQSASPITIYWPRMKGMASIYGAAEDAWRAKDAAPAAKASSAVRSVELSTIRISPEGPFPHPSRHQAMNSLMVDSSLSAGTTSEIIGSATSPSGTSRVGSRGSFTGVVQCLGAGRSVRGQAEAVVREDTRCRPCRWKNLMGGPAGPARPTGPRRTGHTTGRYPAAPGGGLGPERTVRPGRQKSRAATTESDDPMEHVEDTGVPVPLDERVPWPRIAWITYRVGPADRSCTPCGLSGCAAACSTRPA